MPTDKKQAGARLANLRKYIANEQDEQFVKEMIADGLDDEQIFHALGYLNGAPDQSVLPEDHEFSHVPTDEQLEQEQAAQEQQQSQGANLLQALLGGGGARGPAQPQQPRPRGRR